MAPMQRDEALLERFAFGAFRYFLENVNPENGLWQTPRERVPHPVSPWWIRAVVLSGRRREGLDESSRGGGANAGDAALFLEQFPKRGRGRHGYKGFYYHFLDLHTGKRAWNSELSLIDSAILLAGIMATESYFSGGAEGEAEIRDLADALYGRMDWRWAQNGRETVCQGWKPEFGFLHYGWEGYSEATILYVLGLASPTYALAADYVSRLDLDLPMGKYLRSRCCCTPGPVHSSIQPPLDRL